MQVHVENTGNLGRRIRVSVPNERVEQKVSERMKQMAKNAKVDGFRPGKAPMDVIKARYGKAVHDEVVGDVMQTSLYEALTQEKLNPAGSPMIEDIKMEEGQPLEYVASFEIYPEVHLKGLEELEIHKNNAEIAEKDIDATLDKIRQQNQNWEKVERAAKEGDRLTIDLEIHIPSKGEEKQNQKDLFIVLGSKAYLPGFEEKLLGTKAGDVQNINLTFPEEFPDKDVAGKEINFVAAINEVAEPKLPELDDAFATRLGVKEGGIAALREQVKKHMTRELNHVLRNQLKSELFEKLVAQNPIEVPKALIEREANYLHQQMHSHDKVDPQSHGAHDHPGLEDSAKRRVTISLLIAEIIKANQLKVDPEKVRALIEETAASYEHPEQVVTWYLSDKERMASFESLALEEQVVDFILGKAKIIEKSKGYEEIMKPEHE